jgi:hypothetical protein
MDDRLYGHWNQSLSGVFIVFKVAYHTTSAHYCTLQVWYRPINVYFVLFHVEFEDGSSNSF